MPKTLHAAIKHFADPEVCIRFMISVRWADGQVRCPTCDSLHVKRLGTSQLWKCYSTPNHPRQKFSLKVGTIFEDSPLPLEKWMMAIWLVANCKNGISSCEMARHLGITQKSAWHMDHRVRAAMRVGSLEKLAGDVEVDETFIGGKARNMHIGKKERRITGTGGKDKVAVMGILSRGGEARTMVVPSRRKTCFKSRSECTSKQAPRSTAMR